ncbi:FecR family protein [Parabacteroides johnsonii]|uniref:FecR family protein n=1 Tax=Parabacteroides johnsonii TaxID=387661 RepID=UPI00242FD619|nr:FecR domain-containing protein [Parabacteroides johnsonii]
MEKEHIYMAVGEPENSVILKYIRGTASEEEKAEVNIWQKKYPENEKVLLQIARIYYACRTQERIVSRDPLRAYWKVDKKLKSQKKDHYAIFYRIVIELLKVAAIVLILLGGNFLLQKDDQMESFPSFQTLYVPAGQRAELVLPDSTRVWLNANSKLVYSTSFKEGIRQVELDGEAYFDVKHNGDNPFVVRTKSMNVMVLGTEFNVSAYSGIEEFNIALLRGSVELNPSDRSGKYRMKAGEQVFYKEGKYVSAEIGNMDYFKWKEGVLSFNNQPIHVIIDKLRLYYDIRIEVTDLPFLEERYSGKFRVKEGIEQVLKVLQLEHKFTYVKDNELNLITIK